MRISKLLFLLGLFIPLAIGLKDSLVTILLFLSPNLLLLLNFILKALSKLHFGTACEKNVFLAMKVLLLLDFKESIKIFLLSFLVDDYLYIKLFHGLLELVQLMLKTRLNDGHGILFHRRVKIFGRTYMGVMVLEGGLKI